MGKTVGFEPTGQGRGVRSANRPRLYPGFSLWPGSATSLVGIRRSRTSQLPRSAAYGEYA